MYHSIREDLEEQGVLFLDMDSGLKEYPEIVKEYFGTVIPASDNKFSALNTAVWSGGSFIYVPKGVHVEMPVQAYFRINARTWGSLKEPDYSRRRVLNSVCRRMYSTYLFHRVPSLCSS